MAYDPVLAQRIRESLSEGTGIMEMKQFGGIGFMVNGNMACGVIGNELIVRVGPEGYESALELPHARPFDFAGKPSRGWVYVASPGFESDGDLRAWVQRGISFASTLPAK